jgi:hypothetical protein
MNTDDPIEAIAAQRRHVDELNERALALPSDAMSLDLLQAIYRSAKQPLPVRMRAAALALPHEFPKLQAVISADVLEQAFGNRLERARLRTIEGIPPREGPTPQPRALPRPGLPK